MLLSKAYIIRHRTEHGSWTRTQIEALGLEWPPSKGWQDRVIGNDISYNNMMIFEAKEPARERRTLKWCLRSLKYLSHPDLLVLNKEINLILKRIKK